jgi:hypothetical protein
VEELEGMTVRLRQASAAVYTEEEFLRTEHGSLMKEESVVSVQRIEESSAPVMQDHLDMLDSCMKDLGLTQGKLLKIHAKLMTGCTLFAQYTASLSRSLYAADPDLASGVTMPPIKRPAAAGATTSTAKRKRRDSTNRGASCFASSIYSTLRPQSHHIKLPVLVIWLFCDQWFHA